MRIYSRTEWGAQYGRGFGPAPLPVKEVWLHHGAVAGGGLLSTFATDCAAVRLLEQIGQARFAGGISYTFAVTESGRVFEGHGIDRKGAHTKGRNSVARAIVLVGNYEKADPTGPQLDSVAALLVWGQAQGWWLRPALNGGHRDAPGASTACPGARAYARIPAINTAAALGRKPQTQQEDDLTPDEARMLREVHAELFKRLDNRRGPGGQTIENGGADTLLGYAANTDGATFRAAWTLEDLMARQDTLAGLVQQQGAMDYDQLAAALLRQMATGG